MDLQVARNASDSIISESATPPGTRSCISRMRKWHLSATDITTREQLIHAYKGGSSFGEVAALEKMLSTIDARKFVCGHNDVIDRTAVRNHIARMKVLQAKVRDLKMKGRSIEEVQKQFEQNQSALVQAIYNEIK